MMAHSASQIPFLALCQVLEGIQSKKGVAEKRKLLQKFVDEWRNKTFDVSNQEDSFYPMLRCMVPQLEKIAYGIKQHSLGRLYVDVMGLGKKSEAATILMNYKNPTMSTSINSDRCSVKSTLSVMQVIEKLNDIANGYTGKDKLLVKSTLEYLIKNLTGLENKWFIRMLVKDMKLGLGQDSILAAVHPDAPALFNVDTSLERVCLKLRDIKKRLHEVEVSLFAPLKPMLGKQVKPNEVEAQLQSPTFLIERKFDGERMQLHMEKGAYKYFSRNGHEYTNTYGATQFEGNLTPRIHKRLKGVTSCILDGEMCGYDEELQVLGTKAMNFDIKSASLSRYIPCYAVFDILYLNGDVLTNVPLKDRLKKLPEIIEDEEGVIFASGHTTASTNKECIDALNKAIDGYEEGIMVKHPESVYKPNSRSAGWYKMKPEYVDGLMDELDLVIIGGYFGKGRRANILSHFLCAVMDNSTKPAQFHSVTKVGSGYSYKELLDFNLKLKSHWQKAQPSSVLVSKEKPDIWIDPFQSALLQIKATEVVESSSFYTGYSLRFPRVDKIRDDKDPTDCLTLNDFSQLRTRRSGQLTGGLVTDEMLDEPKPKKRRQPAARSVAPTIAQQFKAADTAAITKEVDTFDKKEFCVVQGTKVQTKQQLEQEIVKMGGSIVQNAGDNTFCIVTDRITIKIRNYMKANKYNIARVEWLCRCIESQTLQKWEPCDMIHASPALQKLFDLEYDRFGDEHSTNTSTEQLRKIFTLMPPRKPTDPLVESAEIREVEEELITNEDYERALFRGCRFYDADEGEESRTTLNLIQARFYGGVVSHTLDKLVTHCLCSSSTRVSNLKELNQTREQKFHIVSSSWVEESIEAGKLLKERAFPIS
ncbi:DNA ligase 4-like isoform X2 [Watersipora subatra]|uniref:DNA ligase 4-like isoform X2 n=1 Tax=Watersipora subatra TaxID=2589382 RepID=UPI00355BD73A